MKLASTILYTVLYAVLNVSGAAIIKKQLQLTPITRINDYVQLMLNVKVVAAFLLIVISALVMFKALSTNSFTFVVPLATGINFLLTIAVGYYLFNDQFSVVKVSGIIFILTGIILLSIGEKSISGS